MSEDDGDVAAATALAAAAAAAAAAVNPFVRACACRDVMQRVLFHELLSYLHARHNFDLISQLNFILFLGSYSDIKHSLRPVILAMIYCFMSSYCLQCFFSV